MDYPARAESIQPALSVQFSPREIEVIEALCRGLQNKEIARRLGCSEATVKVHLKVIARLIGRSHRMQIILWALSHGFRNGLADEAPRV